MSLASKRLFITVQLPVDLTQELNNIQHALHHNVHGKLNQLRWTPIKNLNITTFFIGDVPTTLVPELLEQVQVIANNTETFYLEFHAVQTAPEKEPRMFWASYKSNPTFEKLVTELHTKLQTFGTQKNDHESITPHVTLARFNPTSPLDKNTIPQIKLDRLVVTHIAVTESTLGGSHPHYTELASYRLTGSSHSSS